MPVLAAAVIGAAFLLTWGTELAEIYIGEGLALPLPGALTSRGAWELLGPFVVQFVLAWTLPGSARGVERVGLAVIYLLLAAVLLVVRRGDLMRVLRTSLLGSEAEVSR